MTKSNQDFSVSASAMSHDKAGVEWARLSKLKPGDALSVDDGFTCMRDGELKVVCSDRRGELWVECKDGCHFLDGQADDGDHLIGMYALKDQRP